MRLNISMIPGRLCVLIAFILAMGAASYGQGNVEVTGHFGIVGGIGDHGSVGGSIASPVTDRLILSGELGDIPMGSRSVTVNGATTKSSANGITLNANLQYQFNAKHSVTPYAGAGIGLLRTSSDVSTTRPNAMNVSASSTDAYFNMGGGLRYYVKPNWGFRPEFTIFAGPNSFVRFVGGIFYQFGE